ncbi:heat shock protein 70 family protein [Kipferlia bialata]|uniref:Heat shock protein 70 family protein n=1 Tax=Kipferlia bialata TaxID=797122 RepID=A0A9K3D3X8_9EUKA|nr:heat shock protein 70 family protein [Kipferlia bialata]|eukprot:g9165.t1
MCIPRCVRLTPRETQRRQPLGMLVTRFKLLLDHAGHEAATPLSPSTDGELVRADPTPSSLSSLSGLPPGIAQQRGGAGGGMLLPPGLDVVDVIGDYLRFMAQHVAEIVASKYEASGLTLDNVKWCLTVPAMWTPKAKSQMRQAAHRAGMIPDYDCPRLEFVLEPEAAAAYGLSAPDSSFSGCHPFRPREGESFMVVDAGGGTVDITVHQRQDGFLYEVTRGHGDSCGGTFVDVEFMRLVRQRLGDAFLDKMEAQHPREISALLASWYSVRDKFDGEIDVDVPLPPGMTRRLPPKVISTLEEAQDGYSDVIEIRPMGADESGKNIFDPVVDKVLQCIETQMQRVEEGQHPLHSMLLVGGFSSNPYLRKRIEERFSDRVGEIVYPLRPGEAVVMGAAHYALNPSIIKSRVARYSYGIKCSLAWDETDERHRAHAEHRSPDGIHLRGCFDPILRQGTSVPVGQSWSENYKARDTCGYASFQLYVSSAPDPLLCSDEGVTPLGDEIRINVPPVEKKVGLQVQFGQTEVQMTMTPAFDPSQKRVVKVSYRLGV